jgi:hypothetical protein
MATLHKAPPDESMVSQFLWQGLQSGCGLGKEGSKDGMNHILCAWLHGLNVLLVGNV